MGLDDKLPDKKNFLKFSLIRKKFKNHPITEKIYEDTMQEYIFQGHTSKLNKTEPKRTTPTNLSFKPLG